MHPIIANRFLCARAAMCRAEYMYDIGYMMYPETEYLMKKTMTSILSLLCAASMLTACGVDATSPAKTTDGSTATTASAAASSAAVSSETTVSAATNTTAADTQITAASSSVSAAATTDASAVITTAAAAQTGAAAISGSMAEAKAVLEQFMSALEKKDDETVLRLSNLGSMVASLQEIAKNQQGEVAENAQKQADSMIRNYAGNFGHFKGYEITDGADAAEFAEYYNKSIDECENEIQDTFKEVTESIPELLSLSEEILTPIKKLYVFTVKSKEGSGSQEMYVRLNDDEWQVDVLSFDMLRYVAKSKLASANQSAKTIQRALLTAVTEMDAEGCDFTKLAGTYTYHGTDLKNLDKNSKKDIDILLRKMLEYSPDAVKMEEFAFVIDKKPDIPAVAVKTKGTVMDVRTGEREVFGAAPQQIPFGDASKYQTLKDALAFAPIEP